MSRPKKLLHCVKLKLLTNKDEMLLLDDLQRSFRETYNRYLLLLNEHGLLTKTELELYPIQHRLLENTRQCARDVAIESVRSYEELKEEDKRTQFPKQSDEPLSTRLNYRDGYIIPEEGVVRISIRKGILLRLSYEFDPKNRFYFEKAFQKEFRFGSSVLVRKKNVFYLHVNIGIGRPPYPDKENDYTFIGVDANEKNLALSAMTSTGKLLRSVILEYTEINAHKHATFTTRKRLGRAKQVTLMKQLGDKEKRWNTDLYHKITTFAIQWITAEKFTNPFLILEDLKWIRKHVRFGKRMNRRLHTGISVKSKKCFVIKLINRVCQFMMFLRFTPHKDALFVRQRNDLIRKNDVFNVVILNVKTSIIVIEMRQLILLSKACLIFFSLNRCQLSSS